MSEQFFANYPDYASAQQAATMPSPNGRDSMGGTPTMEAFAARYPQPGPSGPPPYLPTPSVPNSPARWAPQRMAVVALSVLSVGLGGLAFTSHNSASEAQTHASSLSDSLTKANASVAAKQGELKKAKESGAAASSQLELVGTCAQHLHNAWSMYFNKDYKTAGDELRKAEESCSKVFDENGN